MMVNGQPQSAMNINALGDNAGTKKRSRDEMMTG